MKLREIVLAGAMLLSSAAFSQSQDKLHFDIYSKGGGVFNLRLKNSSLRINPDKIDFSLIFGIYSVELKKLNDSIYQETVRNNFIFESKEEFFNYSFKDSCYTLDNYFAVGGKPREEKEILKGRVFDEKYKSPPEVLNDFKNGNLKDSIHFIVFGMPYSIRIEKVEKDGDTIYFYNPKELVKREPGDLIIFPYPAEVVAKNRDGKVFPFKFSTKALNAKNGRDISIEGILKENKD